MKKTPPCEGCLCLPMCRHKRFYDMLGDCALLFKYDTKILEAHNRDPYKLMAIETLMKPSTWKYIIRFPNAQTGKYRVIAMGGRPLGEDGSVRAIYEKMSL